MSSKGHLAGKSEWKWKITNNLTRDKEVQKKLVISWQICLFDENNFFASSIFFFIKCAAWFRMIIKHINV